MHHIGYSYGSSGYTPLFKSELIDTAAAEGLTCGLCQSLIDRTEPARADVICRSCHAGIVPRKTLLQHLSAQMVVTNMNRYPSVFVVIAPTSHTAAHFKRELLSVLATVPDFLMPKVNTSGVISHNFCKIFVVPFSNDRILRGLTPNAIWVSSAAAAPTVISMLMVAFTLRGTPIKLYTDE